MAGKKATDEIEEALSLFPAGSAKALQRLLKRAQEKEIASARRNVAKAMRGGMKRNRLGSRIGKGLVRELAKAVRQRGAPRKEAASIRQKSASGGKPFHFAHSVVTKADPTAPSTSRAAKAGKAAAHMRYIERETAVEAQGRGPAEVGALAEEIARDIDARGEGRGRGDEDRKREAGEGRAAGPTMGSAAAAQGYVENRKKLANGEAVVFSFGNIGDSFAERVAFWNALEEAEAHPNARVQHRLIIELPHEATPAARHEIVRGLSERFEKDGVPYWAALHAPGEGNDSRNFHAHLVYSERPAKRVVDPADGTAKWDFEVRREWVDSSRHRQTSRPLRQDKVRAYNDKRFIPQLRKHYAELANAVLTRDAVRDADGAPVLYDHRSYKDMGLDVVPMRSINRIVADKLKDGTATVLDGDYTRKMVASEIQAAARARDRKVLDLLDLEKALDEVARDPAKATKVNARLPRQMRVSPMAKLTKSVLETASRKLLEARHEALRLDVMEKATLASLERIVEATEPKAVAAAAKSKDPVIRAQAPNPATAALLNEAAREEVAETKAEAAKSRRTLRYRIGIATEAWRVAVSPPPPEPSAALKRVRQAQAEQERGPLPSERTGANQALSSGTARASDGKASAQAIPERRLSSDAKARIDGTVSKTPEAPAVQPATADARTVPPGAREEAGPGPSERVAASGAHGSGQQAGAPKAEAPEAGAAKAKATEPTTERIEQAAKMLAGRLMERTAAAIATGGVKPSKSGGGPRRAPTMAETLAASMGVGGFIKAIKKLDLTVDQRLDMLQLWTTRPIRKSTSAGPAPGGPKRPFRADAGPAATPQSTPRAPGVDERPAHAGTKPDVKQTVAATATPERGEATQAGAPEAAPPTGGTAVPIETVSDRVPAEAAKPSTPSRQGELWLAESGPEKVSPGRATASATPLITIGEPVEMALADTPEKRAGADEPPRDQPAASPGPAPVARAVDGEPPASGKARRKRRPEEIEEDERRRKQRKAVLAQARKKRNREIGR